MLIQTTPNPELAELERLGDEIAVLSAHIEVATARLLESIREFEPVRAGLRLAPNRAPSGWPGASASSCTPRASGCGRRVHSAVFPRCNTRSLTASCPTPRSAPSRA